MSAAVGSLNLSLRAGYKSKMSPVLICICVCAELFEEFPFFRDSCRVSCSLFYKFLMSNPKRFFLFMHTLMGTAIRRVTFTEAASQVAKKDPALWMWWYIHSGEKVGGGQLPAVNKRAQTSGPPFLLSVTTCNRNVMMEREQTNDEYWFFCINARHNEPRRIRRAEEGND